MTSLPAWYKRTFIQANTAAAAIIATTAITALWTLDASPSQELRSPLYQTIATIAGSLTGFTILTTALILKLWDHKSLFLIAQHPKRSREIRTILTSATYTTAATTATSLAAMSIDAGEIHNRILASAVILTATLSTIRISETIWLIQRIAAVITTSRNTTASL